MSLLPELGYFALAVALLVAVLQATLPWLAVRNTKSDFLGFASCAASAQTFLVLFSYLCLSLSLIHI